MKLGFHDRVLILALALTIPCPMLEAERGILSTVPVRCKSTTFSKLTSS